MKERFADNKYCKKSYESILICEKEVIYIHEPLSVFVECRLNWQRHQFRLMEQLIRPNAVRFIQLTGIG